LDCAHGDYLDVLRGLTSWDSNPVTHLGGRELS
jgi:hypothetical protein